MSENIFDCELPALHFRRFISRLYKRLKGVPLALADISVIHIRNAEGTVYEARRGRSGGWTVYRIYSSAYEKDGGRPVYEGLSLEAPLTEALNELNLRCPQCLTSNAGSYNHPARVAQLVKHVFA